MLELLNRGWSREELAQRSLFTTHTPVPAGHDRFEWPLVREVVGELLPVDAKELVIAAGILRTVAAARCPILLLPCQHPSMLFPN